MISISKYALQWDLDTLFAGGSDSQEFACFLDRLESDIDSLHTEIKHVNDMQDVAVDRFRRLVGLVQDVAGRLREARSFVNCLTAQNVKDEKGRLLLGRVRRISARYSTAMTEFDEFVRKLSQPAWDRMLTEPELHPISFPLHEIRRRAADKLSPEQEMLAGDLAVDGYHAWSDLYDTVVGRIVISFERDGQTEELSVGQAFNQMNGGDREERIQLFKKWQEVWAREAELCANVLNHLAGFRLSLYHHRGWDSVLKEPLEMNRMSERTLQTMWDVIDRNKRPLVAYLNGKRNCWA